MVRISDRNIERHQHRIAQKLARAGPMIPGYRSSGAAPVQGCRSGLRREDGADHLGHAGHWRVLLRPRPHGTEAASRLSSAASAARGEAEMK
jgi:hypothetical protein